MRRVLLWLYRAWLYHAGMAKLTKAERAELESRLAADDDEPDDDDDEVEIGLGDGKYFRGKMRHARTVAGAHGFKMESDPPKPPAKRGGKSADGGKDDDEGQGDSGGAVRFGRRVS
jgi:hypothetical protein